MQTQTFFFLFCVLCSFLWLKGKGRGRQVISVGKTADMIMMMLDATKGEVQKWETILFATLLPNFFSMADHFVFWRALLEKELEDVGIRLNSRPPNIYFKVFLLFSFILFFSHFFSFFSPCLWRSRRVEVSRSTLSSSWPIWTKSWLTWFSVNTVNLHVFFFFRFSPPAILMLTSGSGRLFCRDLQRRSIDQGGLHTR